MGHNSAITNSVIGESSVVHENVTITGSIIGPGCVIGAGAQVLEGSRVWPGIQILESDVVRGIVVAPLETAFYCFTNFGQYAGLLATSIDGFIEVLEKSPIESIEFHARRRDYEKWIRSVLGLNELADAMEDIRRRGVTGEDLRRNLVVVTKKWADAIQSTPADNGSAKHEALDQAPTPSAPPELVGPR